MTLIGDAIGKENTCPITFRQNDMLRNAECWRLMQEIADLKKMLATVTAERDFYRSAWERDRG